MQMSRIGNYTVTRIEEQSEPGFAPAALFEEFDEAVFAEEPLLASPEMFHGASGVLISSIHTWLVRGEGHVILIDTGCGNAKERPDPRFQGRFHMLNLPFLERLESAGVRAGDVTHVLNTHLHIDHVGWNTKGSGAHWTPTFPKARYVMGGLELAYWLEPATVARGGDQARSIDDSVRPVLRAGLVDTVKPGDAIVPGLTVEAAPGHTIGHLAFRLSSSGETALFTGDVMHHAMQVVRPRWNSRFCIDQDAARKTRARILDDAAEQQIILFPSHFGLPHGIRVRREGSSYRPVIVSA